ncbi:MAG: cytochrome c oxidase assembly protein [Alphaproteobacteria bacterium]
MKQRRANSPSNRAVATVCATLVVAMVGAAYAAVPLYRLFCQVTGYGGTTQNAASASTTVLERQITIRLDANTARDMPWQFAPVEKTVPVKLGENRLVYFRATNPTDQTITGTATFNVTPLEAGVYFNKVACFCFTEQVLQPGQTVDMPVSFFVDPAFDADPIMKTVTAITLSYTFYRTSNGNPANAKPNLGQIKTGASDQTAARVTPAPHKEQGNHG